MYAAYRMVCWSHIVFNTFAAVNCVKCTNMQNCGFELEYGDGSTIEGEVIEDKFTVGGITVRNYVGAIQNIDLKNWEPVRKLLSVVARHVRF